MHTTFRLSVFLLFMVQLFCSCTSDSLPEPDSTQPETPAGIPDASKTSSLSYHFSFFLLNAVHGSTSFNVSTGTVKLWVPSEFSSKEIRSDFPFHVLKISAVPKRYFPNRKNGVCIIFIVVWRSAHGIGAFVPPILMELRPVNGVLSIVSK